MEGRPDPRQLWAKVRDRAVTPRHPGGLAALRILYGAVIFGEVLQLIEHRELIFGSGSAGWLAETDPLIGLSLWALAAVALTVGAWTRRAAVVNLVCSLTHLGGLQIFEYHHDYAMMAMGTLFVLLPVGSGWSVDAWRRRKGAALLPESRQVLQVHHDTVLFLGVALFYFDSVFFKLGSPMWRHGLGMWMPASFPNVAVNDLSLILDLHWLVLGFGYLTLVFEAAFIVLMWWRRAHVPLFVVGVGLHLGIVVAFPIPWFGLGVAALYLLLLPDAVWQRLEPVELPARAASMSWNGRGLIAVMVLSLCTQFYIIGVRTEFSRMLQPMEMGEVLWNFRATAPGPVEGLWLKGMGLFLGVRNHPVFMDAHFQGYNDLYTLRLKGPEGVEPIWVGPLSPSGSPTEDSAGRLWVYFTFRFNGPGQRQGPIPGELARYTRYWSQKNGLPLHGLHFEILHRPNDVPSEWQEGFYRQQKDRPWARIGEAVWIEGEMQIRLDRPKSSPAKRRP